MGNRAKSKQPPRAHKIVSHALKDKLEGIAASQGAEAGFREALSLLSSTDGKLEIAHEMLINLLEMLIIDPAVSAASIEALRETTTALANLRGLEDED